MRASRAIRTCWVSAADLRTLSSRYWRGPMAGGVECSAVDLCASVPVLVVNAPDYLAGRRSVCQHPGRISPDAIVDVAGVFLLLFPRLFPTL